MTQKNEEIDLHALGHWLEDNVAGFEGPFTLDKFAAGQSNPTYALSAASGDYVLRRKPFGELLPSAHAVDREYRLLCALTSQGYPVPLPWALCADPDVIGSIFYVMDRVEGQAHFNGALPYLDGRERRHIYEQLVDTLADLHVIDVEAAGLADFGKRGNYFERQVTRWTRQYRDSQTDDLESMEKLIEFLPRTLPEQQRVSIVHGDYRIDNVLFADGALTAVLDWELATLGDPLADFSYLAMQWLMPADGVGAALGGLDLATLDIPSLEEISARYSARSGVAVAGKLDWYFAFNLFRLAGIVQGIKKRVIDGTASNAKAAEMAKKVPMLSDTAWTFAQKAGA